MTPFLSPCRARGGCCTVCFPGSHGSPSPSGQPAWLCPPAQGQGLPRSPLPGTWTLCQPHCRAGRAQPTLCGHGDRQRQGREAALVPAASGNAQEAGRMLHSIAEPRAEQGPSFAVSGDSSETLREDAVVEQESATSGCCMKSKHRPAPCKQRVCSPLSPARPQPLRPVPEPAGRIRQAPSRASWGRREPQQHGVPRLPLPANLICSQSWSEGLMVHKPTRTAGSANRPSIC